MGMGMMRRSTSAASLKVPVRPLEALGSSSLLQYVFGLGGEAPAAARFLALLFDAPAFERGHFTRDFGRASRPQDKLPISFWPLVGYAGSYMFEDAMLRKCEALIYVYDVHQGSVADFRRIRKRISAIRDIKVAVVAFSPSGGLLDEEAEVRAHECKILAGNYGCAYFELGLDKALSPIVAEEIVSQTFDDVVGSRSDDAAPKAAAPNTPTSPITSPTRAARKVQLGFIGDIFVGKSTLIQKLAYGQSLEQYTHTDQVQSHHKKLCFEEQNLKLQLVDTMPSIADLPAELLEKVQGWVLVFSVRNMASFRMLTQLVQHIRAKSTRNSPIMVVGTNADELIMRVVSKADAQRLCETMDAPYVEVNCHSDAVTPEAVLGPLLSKVLNDKYLEREESAPATKELIDKGTLYLFKDDTWVGKIVEIRKDLLVYRDVPILGPAKEQASSPNASPSSKDERRFSGIFASVRRRNSLRQSSSQTSLGSPEKNSSGGLPKTAAAAASTAGSTEFQTLFLGDCICASIRESLNSRFGFRVVDAIGKQLRFEADTAEERDRWIYSIKKASTEREQRDELKSSGGLINSGTLSRKRGKTFNGARSSSSTTMFNAKE